MLSSKHSSDKSLQQVSKRHIVSDISDRLKVMQEEEAKINREREEFSAMKDIADYCDLKLVQKPDFDGNDLYIIFKKPVWLQRNPNDNDMWMPAQTFSNLEETKKYLVEHKRVLDGHIDERAEREGLS